MSERVQYRLRWKREGGKEKRKIYWSRTFAENRALLMGPEPWKAFGVKPDDNLGEWESAMREKP